MTEGVYQDHYVAFEDTEVGKCSLRLFRDNVPEQWRADFYELDRSDPEGDPERRVMIQYFRTEHAINRFIATPLVRDLPGSIDWSWNSVHEALYEQRVVRKQAEEESEEV